MKILIVGGGSGGHVTPAVAVAREIFGLKPRAKIEFWTDRKYYRNVTKTLVDTDGVATDEVGGAQAITVRKVVAGKFRRYHFTFAEYFKYWQTTLKDLVLGNIIGFCGFMMGLVQSLWRMAPRSRRPDVVFLKGGYVGLPVGLVAGWLKIPYVIHESDSVFGLANRILSKMAAVVCTGAEMETSDEELARKLVVTGTPVATEFRKVSGRKEDELKRACGFDVEKPLVIVTGGSQGAEHINLAMREILPEMLKFTSVGLIAGRAHYEEMVDLKRYEEWDRAKLQSNFRMWEFSTVMNELLGAADVVVSRAGATTIAELAALKKAVILIPYEKLPGGHQTVNAERLERAGAAVVIPDEKMVKKPELLLEAVRTLVRSPRKRADLAEALAERARPDAAKRIAEMVVARA